MTVSVDKGIYTHLNKFGFKLSLKYLSNDDLPAPGSPVINPKPLFCFKKSNLLRP